MMDQNDRLGQSPWSILGGKVTGRIALDQETLEELKVARGKAATKVGLVWPRVLSRWFLVVDSILSLSLPVSTVHSSQLGRRREGAKPKPQVKERNGISEGSD